MIFYKRPYLLLQNNKNFNYNLLKIQIKSKYAIEYLKSTFQLLKKLQLNLFRKNDIVYIIG